MTAPKLVLEEVSDPVQVARGRVQLERAKANAA